MSRSLSFASLAVLLALTSCTPDASPEPPPELSCSLVSAVPRTIEVSMTTPVAVTAQCSFTGGVGVARERALATTLSVVGAEVGLNDASFSDSGLLTLMATITPAAGEETGRGALSIDEATGSLASGRVFFHVSDEALRAEFTDAPGQPCLMLCEDGTGRQEPEYFEGATCGCSSSGVLARLESAGGLPTSSWTHVLVSHNRAHVSGWAMSRQLVREMTRMEADVELPGLDPTTLVAQQTMIVRDGNGDNPELVWWGVAGADTPGIYAFRLPLHADALGTPVVLDATAITATRPPAFVSAVELEQPADPTALPRPMMLYAYPTEAGPMAWALVELFSGATGTGAAVFSDDGSTWAEVTPEEVQAGTASVGLTRIGSASLDPHRGISPETEARAWSARPDPMDASRTLVSVFTGAGAGLLLESQAVLASSGRACWNIGPAPGGFVVSHRSLRDEGTAPSSSAPSGGVYFASAADDVLGLAPLQDFRGTHLDSDLGGVASCAPSTPRTWPATPVDDGGGEGHILALRGWRLQALRAVSIPRQPSRRSSDRGGSHFLTFQVAGRTAAAPGGSDALTPTHAMPLVLEDPSMLTPLAGSVRAMLPLNGSQGAISQPLSSTTCTPEAPCTRPLLTAADDSGLGISEVFTGTGAPTVVMGRYGDIIFGGLEPLDDFNDRVGPPVMLTDATSQDSVVLLTTSGDGGAPSSGVIHVDAEGGHGGLLPLGLTGDAGPVVHTLLTDAGSVVLLRYGGRGAGLNLERAERADLIDRADGVTPTLTTTSVGSFGPVDSFFDLGTGLDRSAPPLRSFTATASASAAPLPADGLEVAPGDSLTWVSLLESNSASGCGGIMLLLGGADGSVTTQELSPAPADASCEGVERGALVGDFLATGGMQILTQRVEGMSLTLRLWYLTDTGLFAVDFGSYVLPYPSAPVNIWGADLDHDGLVDAMVDVGGAAGVLVGFSDGLGGARDGLHSVMGVSGGLTPVPGPAPGVAAHFGKGTTHSASATSARPELL